MHKKFQTENQMVRTDHATKVRWGEQVMLISVLAILIALVECYLLNNYKLTMAGFQYYNKSTSSYLLAFRTYSLSSWGMLPLLAFTSLATNWNVNNKVKVHVKFTVQQAMNAQSGSTATALLFL